MLVCDRCRQSCGEDVEFVEIDIPECGSFPAQDLCICCRDALRRIVNHFSHGGRFLVFEMEGDGS